jgi:hypothetical protein
MTPVVRIVVTDLATGESETQDVADNDYWILTTGACHVSHTQVFPTKGTHILTIKGRNAQ